MVFLYREVLKQDPGKVDALRARRVKRLPVVLTAGEVKQVVERLRETDTGLVVRLLYGCGLRIAEGLALRVKDVDLEGMKVEVPSGKGDKDRVLTMPRSVVEALRRQLEWSRKLYDQDRADGVEGVYLPESVAVKSLRKVRSALPPVPGDERVTGMLWALSDGHRWRMAVALAKERVLSSQELVQRLECRRQAASHHLQVLLRAGVVRREAAADDGRVAVYRLTEAGEGLVQAGLLLGCGGMRDGRCPGLRRRGGPVITRGATAAQ